MTKEEAFWDWFQRNEASLFEFEKDQDRVFVDLSEAMKRVHPNLTFEFGPNRDGVREFVISAGGLRDAFPAVIELVDKAPAMERWQIIRFRQRHDSLPHINFEGTTVKSDQFRFTLEPNGAKAGITLFIDGYDETKHSLFGNLGYLFLDHSLGEYDVETKVGFIAFKPASAPSKLEKKPLSELAATFDRFLAGRGH